MQLKIICRKDFAGIIVAFETFFSAVGAARGAARGLFTFGGDYGRALYSFRAIMASMYESLDRNES